MEINRTNSINLAIKYCKKFGFMSKSFFWNNLTKGTESTKYRYWTLFLKSQYFKPYRDIEDNTDFFYINPSKLHLLNDGIQPVTRRNQFYFYHDDKIMQVIFNLEQMKFIRQFWTEQELKSNRPLALDLLGGDCSKLPDLVFDLNISGETFRVALEIETTRKSNDRYLRSCIGYSAFTKIDLIIFGTSESRTSVAIKSAINKSHFVSQSLRFGFFDLNAFEKNKLNTLLEVNSNEISIGQFFKNLIEIKTKKLALATNNRCEKNAKTFAENLGLKKESA